MIPVFSADTADEVWQLAASAFRTGANTRSQPSRAGDTREMMRAVMEIEQPRQRWVGSRNPALNPAFAIAEVVWILSGRGDSAFLLPWNRKLPAFSGDTQVFSGAYGARLRRRFGLDQLDRAYQALSANPDTRQAVLQIWDCTIDLPDVDGTARSADIPCNIMSCLKVRDGRLDWTQMLRSNDLVLGTPYNIIQFTTLQEVLAGWLGLELGTYVQMSDSLHIYDRDIEVISNPALDPLPANTDSLMLPKMESDRFFGLLEERIEGLSKPLTSARLVETAHVLDAPQSFQNLLAIMGAEAARRQKSEDAMARCMEFCHNPALLELWARWRQRFAR